MIHYRIPDGVGAVFEPRPDTSDFDVIEEVWGEGVYSKWPIPERVLDLGANVGAFTILAAKSGAHVVAVEPDADNLDRLHRHLSANGLHDRVDVVPVAAVARVENEPALVAWLAGEDGTAHLVGRGGDGARPVHAIDVAELVEGLGPFDLVKMDVEGAEWQLLPRLLDCGMAGIARLVMEHHGPAMCSHLADRADEHEEEFGRVVARLAELGRVEILGRPHLGGTLWWDAY